jgi:hypothetical protein
MSVNAQIEPFVDYDWTIEKIETFDGTIILADPSSSGFFDKLIIEYSDFLEKYVFEFSSCQGEYSFDDSNQEFEFLFWGCAITPNHTNIADHFINVFILEEVGETITEEGNVYGPFSYDFSYTDDLVYLHITNLAGSVATFYATFLSQDEFINESITIYPNPATDILKIESSSVAIDKIRIYDLRGRLVEKYDGVKNQMDVSHLQQGVFIIEIETAEGILRRKLIKK